MSVKENKIQFSNSEDLSQYLWDMINQTRGAFSINDPGSAYGFLALIFLQRIIDSKIKKSYSNIIIPKDYTSDTLINASEPGGPGEEVNSLYNEINKLNPNLGGVFGKDVEFMNMKVRATSSFEDRIVVDILLKLKKIHVDDHMFGLAFNKLIKKIFAWMGRRGGESTTSDPMNYLMINLLEVKSNEEVFDPACGIGGFAVELAAKVYENPKLDFKFTGQDINHDIVNICKMNMILNGLNDFKIFNVDSLENPANPDIKFKKIISDPPLGLRTKVTKNNFFDVMLPVLDNKGKLVTTITPSFLFYKAGKRLREQLIEDDLIECVISLPSGLYLNTTIIPHILILNKTKRKKGEVLFINAENSLKDITIKDINTLSSEGNSEVIKLMDKIRQTYSSWDSVEMFSKIVLNDEINLNSFKLTPKYYVSRIKSKPAEGEFKKIKELIISQMRGGRLIKTKATEKNRIFHIAKELNISHLDLMNFLRGKGIAVSNHMTPVNADIYDMILGQFAKDRQQNISETEEIKSEGNKRSVNVPVIKIRDLNNNESDIELLKEINELDTTLLYLEGNVPNSEIEKKEYWQSHKILAHDTNYILVALSGNKIKPTYINPGKQDITIARNILALEIDNSQINPYFLTIRLGEDAITEQVYRISIGSTINNVKINDFLNLLVDVVPLERQDQWIYDHRTELLESEVRKLRTKYQDKYEQDQDIEYETVGAVAHNFNKQIMKIIGDFGTVHNYLKFKEKQKDKINLKIDPAYVIPDMGDEKIDIPTISSIIDRLNDHFSEMSDTVSRTLKTAQMNRESCSFEMVKIKPFILEVVEKNFSAQNRFEVIVNQPKGRFEAEIDKMHFQRIIYNLVDNANRHGFDDNRKYEIVFDINKDIETKEIIIDYKDNGKGFPTGYTVDEYKKWGKSSGGTAGTGIGGADIFRTIGLHRGRVDVINIEDSVNIKLIIPNNQEGN